MMKQQIGPVLLLLLSLSGCGLTDRPGSLSKETITCGDLTQLPLDLGRIESAEVIPAGAVVMTEPSQPGLPAPAVFCRVKARLAPTASSSISVEVWLPEARAWNGKLLGAGNGGFGNNLTIPALGRL